MHGEAYELRRGRKIIHALWLHLVPQGCSAIHYLSLVEIPLAKVPRPFPPVSSVGTSSLSLGDPHLLGGSSGFLLFFKHLCVIALCHSVPSLPLYVLDPSSLVSSAP